MNSIIGACFFLIASLLWCKEKITDLIFLCIVVGFGIAIGVGITRIYIKHWDTGLPLYKMIVQDYSALFIVTLLSLIIIVIKIMK